MTTRRRVRTCRPPPVLTSEISTAGSSTRSSAGCAAAAAGVIEAVTGSGKTDVAIAAVADALRRDRFVLVAGAVAGADGAVARPARPRRCPSARIGRLGDSGTRHARRLRRARRHPALGRRAPPAAARRPGRPAHRRRVPRPRRRRAAPGAARPSTTSASASPPRSSAADDAVDRPAAARTSAASATATASSRPSPTACAPGPGSPSSGSRLSAEERAEYVATEQRLVDARHHLRRVRGMPLDPFGDFIAAVAPPGRRATPAPTAGPPATTSTCSPSAARSWPRAAASTSCSAASPRRSSAADGALLFTETVRAANHAINRLDPLVSHRAHHRVDGPPPAHARSSSDLRSRTPRRGGRAPGARRGHRRARRQPRHRHERQPHPAPDDPADGPHPAPQAPGGRRPLRDHVRPGHPRGPGAAHRARRLPRRDRADLRGGRRVRRRPLRRARRLPRPSPAPSVVPEPERLGAPTRSPWPPPRPRRRARPGADRSIDVVVADSSTASASRAPTPTSLRPPGRPRPVARRRPWRALEPPAAPPRARARRPTSSSSWSSCPRSRQPKVEPKRLSTGQAPLERSHRSSTAGSMRLHRLRRGLADRCRFRWQVLDQTVACRCA